MEVTQRADARDRGARGGDEKFRGKSTQTLVPRVFGRTANASTRGGPRRRLTPESFLDEFTNDEVRNAAARLPDVGQDSGAPFAAVAERCQHLGAMLALGTADHC